MSILDWIIPPRCIGCGALLEPGSGEICPSCGEEWRALTRLPCHRCGKWAIECRCPIPLPKDEATRSMLDRIPPLGLAQAHLTVYQPGRETVAVYAILRAKNRRLSSYDRFVGRQMAGAIRAEYDPQSPPLLTYCPRSRDKVAKYGTDQARELASGIGRAMGIPVTLLIENRKIRQADQKTKGATERFSGQVGHYCLSKKRAGAIRGRTVWLCDDVQTTGATLLFCAQLLYAAGADRVLALTVAKSVREEEASADCTPLSHVMNQKGRTHR